MRVLLVCTGNTCRSPMAEAMLRGKLEEAGLTGMDVASAGLFAVPGSIAEPAAVQEMNKRGFSIADRKAVQLTCDMLEAADLVLVMTRHQMHQLAQAFPDQAYKVYLLGDSISGGDISDPFGRGGAVYEACAQQMEAMLDAWAARLKKDQS